MIGDHGDGNRYQDNELPHTGRPEEWMSEPDELERTLCSLRGDDITFPPGMRENIMERVRAAGRSPWWRLWQWFMAPKAISLRPVTGMAVAAAILGAFLIARPMLLPPPPAESDSSTPTAVTRFVLIAPGASEVVVTGDFLNWDPEGIPLRLTGETGMWTAEVDLPPGVYHYVFVIDRREWLTDPNATSHVDDGFGQQNSVLLVPSLSSS